jgi:hypothetical protein
LAANPYCFVFFIGGLLIGWLAMSLGLPPEVVNNINDNYYFSWSAGPECNGIYRDHAQKFSGGFSPAKTELKSGCLSQHIHFSHSTVEMAKNFEQSNAYSNFW